MGKAKREARPKPKAHATEHLPTAEAEAAVAAEGPGRRQGGSFRACPEAEPLPMAEVKAAKGRGRRQGRSFRACPEAEPLRMAEVKAAERPGRRQGGSFRACPEAEPLPMADVMPGEGQSGMSGGSFRDSPKAEPLQIVEGEGNEQMDCELDFSLKRQASIEHVLADIPLVTEDTTEPYEAASGNNA